MKKILILVLFFMGFALMFSAAASAVGFAGLVEFQTVDFGSPWFGGQLNIDTDFELPGRALHPDSISLTGVFKTEGYSGRQFRGSIVHEIGENMHTGYGIGWANIGPVSALLGKLKTGLHIEIYNSLQLRGEFLAYYPIWQVTSNGDRQEIFFGVNIGLGF